MTIVETAFATSTIENARKLQTIKGFYFTDHAQKRADERGMSFEAMKSVVVYAQSRFFQQDGEHGGKVYRMSKDCEGRKLTIIAEIRGAECWIVSGFYE